MAVCDEYHDEVSTCIKVINVFDSIIKATNIIQLGPTQSLGSISAP